MRQHGAQTLQLHWEELVRKLTLFNFNQCFQNFSVCMRDKNHAFCKQFITFCCGAGIKRTLKGFLAFLGIVMFGLFAFVVGIVNLPNILRRLIFYFFHRQVLSSSSQHWYAVVRLNLVSLLWKISQISSAQKVRCRNTNDSFCFGTNKTLFRVFRKIVASFLLIATLTNNFFMSTVTHGCCLSGRSIFRT